MPDPKSSLVLTPVISGRRNGYYAISSVATAIEFTGYTDNEAVVMAISIYGCFFSLLVPKLRLFSISARIVGC